MKAIIVLEIYRTGRGSKVCLGKKMQRHKYEGNIRAGNLQNRKRVESVSGEKERKKERKKGNYGTRE